MDCCCASSVYAAAMLCEHSAATAQARQLCSLQRCLLTPGTTSSELAVQSELDGMMGDWRAVCGGSYSMSPGSVWAEMTALRFFDMTAA